MHFYSVLFFFFTPLSILSVDFCLKSATKITLSFHLIKRKKKTKNGNNSSRAAYRSMGGRLEVAPPGQLPLAGFQGRQTIPLLQEGPRCYLTT